MILNSLKWTGRKIKSNRFRSATLFAFLALSVLIGAVQASGPMKPPHPPGRGMWEIRSRPWWPMAPVPKIHIIAVAENETVTFEIEDFPEDKVFDVTLGYIYSRGKNGYPVGSFNSSDVADDFTFTIPQELVDEYRISIRAQTDDTFPYYAFNWFYNNSTNGVASNGTSTASTEETSVSETGTGGVEEAQTNEGAASSGGEQTVIAAVEVAELEEVPSFEICQVEQNESVGFEIGNFPADKVFTVKMGVMPNYEKMEPYHNGRMMPKNEMNWGMPMPQHGQPQHPTPPMYPPEMEKPMKPPKIWIPYYEAGTFETVENGNTFYTLDIPSELTGAYRISMMMHSDDTYPYYAYNWFYNNDATVCGP